MKILHILAKVSQSSGIASVACSFARYQSAIGHDVTIATCEYDGKVAIDGCKLRVYAHNLGNSLYYSISMHKELPALVAKCDLVHTHSNWTFPVWLGAYCAVRFGKQLVVSPHGCLSPTSLAHSAWKKRLVGGFDRWAIRHASLVHAGSELEASWIRQWAPVERVCTIHPGVEVAPYTSLKDPPILLYMGRFHRLKGLSNLIDALKICRAKFKVVLCGEGDSRMVGKLRIQAEKNDLSQNLEFRGVVFGRAKEAILRRSSGLVLPSLSENFGLVIAEALAAGRPVICTNMTPWHDVVEKKCGFLCGTTPEEIAYSLERWHALSLSEREAMGICGREWMKSEFSWRVSTERLCAAYTGKFNN